MPKKIFLWSLFFGVASLALESPAALFDDTEARKKILELEKTVQSQNQALLLSVAELQKTQQALTARLVAIEAVVQGPGLVDMHNQLEALQQEVAKLNGEIELAKHHMDLVQQRQKDLYTDTDTRLRKLEEKTEPTPVPANSVTAPVPEAGAVEKKPSPEAQLLALAHGLLQESKHKEAFDAYDQFIKEHPTSPQLAEAKYGLGYAQYALKNYKSAIITQQQILDLHPDSPKVPEAMLNMANSHIQLGQVAQAKKTLRDLIAKFPGNEVISVAQKRLKALDTLK